MRSSAAKRFHLGKHVRGLGFERVPLPCIVFFGKFAGAVLEVQIAQIVIDHLLALAEVIETIFLGGGGKGETRLRPEDEGGAGEQKKKAREKDLGIHGHRRRGTANKRASKL